MDEINLFSRGRVLSAMAAVNRAFNFNDYPAHDPSCICLTMKSFEQMKYFLRLGQLTDLAIYINRPIALANMTMLEFYTKYHYSYTKPAATTEQFEISGKFPDISKKIYIIRWIKQTERLVRLKMLYPQNGDIFFLRLILRKRAVTSESDAYKFNGVSYPTFQHCARASGTLTPL